MNSMRNGAFAAASLLTVIFMTACSVGGNGTTGGGGNNASNGGTFANTSIGEIVGFGSIIVNGIEFTRKSGLADDRVKLGFTNISGAGEARLKVGMVVKITGSFNSTTGKGEYEAIEFQPELRGRLDSVDVAAGTVTIMGRTVQVETGSQLDGIRDLAELATDLGAGRHPELESSGNLDGNGVLHATRIAKTAVDFVNNSPVEIKGAVTSVGAGAFTIGGVTVNTTGAAFAKMAAADLHTELLVEVKGTFNAATNTIANARIERKQAVEAQTNDGVLTRGLAAGAVANDTFALNGPNGAITVKTAAAAFFKNGVAATPAIVTTGTKLQVEGSLDAAGAIVATKVSLEIEKTVKLRGSLSAKDGTAGTVTVNGVTVSVVPVSRFIDSSKTGLAAFTLTDLLVGDNVEVAGFVDSTGKAVVAQIQRFDPPVNRTFVQGMVSATAANTMTILGITVTVGPATQFKNPDGTPFPGGQAAFMGAIVPKVTVVKARGAFTAPASLDATAEEVQFDQVQ
jgi:hypothetical protein